MSRGYLLSLPALVLFAGLLILPHNPGPKAYLAASLDTRARWRRYH